MKFLDQAGGKRRPADDEENSHNLLSELIKDEKKEPTAVSQESASENLTIDTYLKASYPLIWIRTEEDNRAIELVKEGIKKVKNFSGRVIWCEFKTTTGLLVSKRPGDLEAIQKGRFEKVCEGTNPVAALNYLTNNVVKEDDNPIVLLMHNINHALKVPAFMQCLKDTAIYSRLYGCHIILIGAVLEIPPELSSIITLYDLDLPSQDLFRSNFKNMAVAYSELLEAPAEDADINMLAASAVGMTEMQGENALALSIVSEKRLNPRVIQYEKEQAIKQNEVLEFVHSPDTMDHLAGWYQYKEWLRIRKDAMTPEAIEYGLKFPKGVIVVGIPGCGKSLAARATSSYLGVPLLKFDMGKLFQSRLGMSEQATRSMAKVAEAVAPVVLWIEEIEKSAAGMKSSGDTDGGTSARVMATILTWMQETTKPIFFFATCNNIDTLPPEVYRKGRFSELFGVQEPNAEERADVWRVKLKEKRPNRLDEFNYDELVKISDGYTGAEIELSIEEAMFRAFTDGREFETEDLVTSIDAMIPQSITSADRCNAIREWMKKRVKMVSNSPKSSSPTEIDRGWRRIKGAVDDKTE